MQNKYYKSPIKWHQFLYIIFYKNCSQLTAASPGSVVETEAQVNCFFFQTWWIWVHLGDQNAEPCPQRGQPPWWFHGPKSVESPSWVLQFSTEGPVNTSHWTVCRHTVKLYIIHFITTPRNRFIEICIILQSYIVVIYIYILEKSLFDSYLLHNFR